jgi:hypothetical protein
MTRLSFAAKLGTIRRAAKRGFVGISLCTMTVIAYGLSVWVLGNVHVVEDGQLYRSAKLDRHQLEQVIQRYAIKSILNMRGPTSGEAWYDDELAVSKW